MIAMPFLLKNWQGALGVLGVAVLSVLLFIQKGETRHWHKQSDNFETLYRSEQTAHAQTVTNYRAAAAAARAADKANADRVVAEQQAINERTAQTYEARIADARARAERLRTGTPATNPGSAGTAPVPGSGPPAGKPAGPAPQAGLPTGDALIATEQAIQLDELQRWVKSTVKVDRTGAASSSPSPSGNR